MNEQEEINLIELGIAICITMLIFLIGFISTW